MYIVKANERGNKISQCFDILTTTGNKYRVSQKKVSIKNFNSDLFITLIHSFKNFFGFSGSALQMPQNLLRNVFLI